MANHHSYFDKRREILGSQISVVLNQYQVETFHQMFLRFHNSDLLVEGSQDNGIRAIRQKCSHISIPVTPQQRRVAHDMCMWTPNKCGEFSIKATVTFDTLLHICLECIHSVL